MRKFGLEVEYGGSIDAVARGLFDAGLSDRQSEHGYMGHSNTGWIVKRDGSVSAGGEMVGPPLDFDDPEQRGQVDRAFQVLRDAGATTNRQAGIHIHVDASDLDAVQVAAVARTFTKFEDVLYRLASSGWMTMRPGSGTYCKPLEQWQVDGLSKARSETHVRAAYYGPNHVHASGHGHQSRYYGLNLHSFFYRGTIEFRIFNSSMNADRVQAYIAICVAMVEDARRGKKRSVNKAYRLGGMAAGTTDPAAAYHRFQQVMRYECGMAMDDYKKMNKCWKDSVPQPAFGRR